MKFSINIEAKEFFKQQITDIILPISEKTDESKINYNKLVKQTFIRHAIIVSILVLETALFLTFRTNAISASAKLILENQYTAGNIGFLIYSFSHFPENIVFLAFLWLLGPILFTGLWFVTISILETKASTINYKLLAAITLNGFVFLILAISLSGAFEFVKDLIGIQKNTLGRLFITIFQSLILLAGYGIGFTYSVLALKKQSGSPTGRVIAEFFIPILLLAAIFLNIL